LELIRRLLSGDGSLWITIDDNEAHYLKVVSALLNPSCVRLSAVAVF